MASYTNLGISTLQSRLARVQDNLKRKIADNSNVRNVSSPVDCIRMRARKTYEGDDVSWKVQSVDVISAVFPALTDVPFRKIEVDEKTKAWQLTSLIDSYEDGVQESRYTLQVPYNFDINVNDLIFRIFLDEDIKWPIIVPLQVAELKGDFGGHKIIFQKAICTIPTENFPQEIIDTIHEMAERRQLIGF